MKRLEIRTRIPTSNLQPLQMAEPLDAEAGRGVLLRFQESVLTLAASAADQIRAYPCGFRLIAEDMADDFDNWSGAVMPYLPPDEVERVVGEIHAVERLLGSLDDWAPGNLESETWHAIRARARNIAARMGWALQAPPAWEAQERAQAGWNPETEPVYPLFGGLLSEDS